MTPQETAEKLWNEFEKTFAGLEQHKTYVLTKSNVLKHIDLLLRTHLEFGAKYVYYKNVLKCIKLM